MGNGSEIGMTFSYKVQPSPDGLAQAFILGAEFIGEDDVCMVVIVASFKSFVVAEITVATGQFRNKLCRKARARRSPTEPGGGADPGPLRQYKGWRQARRPAG